ncbi:hypothetical protein C8R43DRAFT_918048 [Mycena crocata]|nr:hypothetical protein C8R43DRAFT_918048 [Mycena crocata]
MLSPPTMQQTFFSANMGQTQRFSHGSPTSSWFPESRKPLRSNVGPIQALPPNRWIISEAERVALEAFTNALRRRKRLPRLPSESRDPDTAEAGSENGSPVAESARRNAFLNKRPEAHQVFRAIEDQELGLLAEIAEYDFPLLLRPLSSGTNRTPLNHAIDCGSNHRGVALLLLGMFSRYINHLDDAEFEQPDVRETLRLLRVNFALAMNRGVMQADTTLAASFLQVYIMSKGQPWLAGTVAQISIALRSANPGEPVQLAGHAVRRYAGRMLKQDEMIASLEDYIGNASADLLLMAAWHSVCEVETTENLTPIPAHYFARDERVFNAFVEKLDAHAELIQQVVGRRLRAQLAVLGRCLEGRATTYRSKVLVVDREFNNLSGT